MKKTIAILLVLVIGMVGVWAAFTDTSNQNLVLNTTVAINNAFKITTSSETGNSFYDVFGITGEANPADASRTLDIDDATDGLTTEAYLTIGTNNPSGFVVYLQSASQLAKDETSTKIDYEISVGDASWDTSDAPVTGVSVGTVTSTTSAVVISKQISVVVDPESYYNAEATTGEEIYTATVVFNISAS